ncbi:uncharacterized protein LOC129757123 [Uranotaenia lowii]|uniref:uncharacterized protein LOC129757123 n=1 Tax=Uranotaenia lowii TaxID=190385 RepID=UPI002479CDFB|nr:uncharacterized protein LOC129757123 [Uranotaenia lowii]
MKKVMQHHGMIKKIAETQKKFKKMREEEFLRQQLIRRNDLNALQSSNPNRPAETIAGSSGSSTGNTYNTRSSTSSSQSSSSATITGTATNQVVSEVANSSRLAAVASPNLNRRITRYALRIHRQLNNDVNSYMENMASSSSSSSEDDTDSDSGDGN